MRILVPVDESLHSRRVIEFISHRDASGTTYSAADLLSLGYVWEGAEENAENLN